MVEPRALTQYLEAFRNALSDAGFECAIRVTPETWNGPIWSEWIEDTTGERQRAQHQVSVLFVAGFPYQEPRVISLDNPPLRRSLHLNPSSPQSLCLWIPEAGWEPHYTAHHLLRRIHEWFCNYHEGRWPSGSEFPDLHRYLPNEGVLVLGEQWQPDPGASHGEFSFSYGRPKVALASTFPTNVAFTELKPEQRLADPLLLGNAAKQQKGIWFRLPHAIVPPATLDNLITDIEMVTSQPNNWTRGILVRTFGVKSRKEGFPLALGYPGPNGEERWLFLWAKLPLHQTKSFHWSQDGQGARIQLHSYQTVAARPDDLFRRISHLGEHLRQAKVAIFGVGALGSTIAVELGKSAVGELRLIDSDIMLPGNAIRHVAGLGWVGYLKTTACEFMIHSHNPDCRIECFSATWDVDALRRIITDCDLVIDATADLNFSLYLNDVCVQMGKSILFAAAYRRASIGRLVFRKEPSDPCLACYISGRDLWEPEEFPLIPPDQEASFIEDGCGGPTHQAAALETDAIANAAARAAVSFLRADSKAGNLCLIVNESIAGLVGIPADPGTYWRKNTPLSNCAVCGTGC